MILMAKKCSIHSNLEYLMYVCFVCLWFPVPHENFSLIWRCHYYWQSWFQILTFTRHSWPLSSDVSLVCHTYCDSGHLSKKTRGTRTCCRVLGSWAVTTCYNNLDLSRLEIEPQSPLPLSHHGSYILCKWNKHNKFYMYMNQIGII